MMELEILKKQIDLSDHEWKNISSTNCYAFSLGLDIPQDEICDSAYYVGHIYRYFNNVKPKYMPRDLLLRYDFTTLDLLYRESSIVEKIAAGEWKIAYFDSIYECGFHFFRQTENGIWWHKYDYNYAPTCLDNDNRIITDPTNYNVNLRGLELKKCYILKRK